MPDAPYISRLKSRGFTARFGKIIHKEFLFPTKALGRDQLDALKEFDVPVKYGVYDGDTPDGEKRVLRDEAGIIMTNLDMLHRGILPNHLKWHRFFSNLKFV